MSERFQWFSVSQNLLAAAARVKLLITDCDGVLTDTGVYYGPDGEELKRFSIRDGMGVERLRKLGEVETAIMTGEASGSVSARAKKLSVTRLFLSAKNKPALIQGLIDSGEFKAEEIGFIGDDTNDLEAMAMVGFSACPSDATSFARGEADYVCESQGGNGAFREVAELILFAQQQISK
jgi:3-deoxy-D-manno-octulosonate 8-phosphate phosphatase (KDO 8-P phosphatase)